VLVGIDAQELAEQLVLVLGVLVGIPRAAAVPGAHVEVAAGAELKLAPVVVLRAGVPDHDHPAA
jgi:hypothetical protein